MGWSYWSENADDRTNSDSELYLHTDIQLRQTT